jgi:hypothetical protein
MICGIDGCTKAARHRGLCKVKQKSKRLRAKIPIVTYLDFKIGTMVNVWWDNYQRYFTGRVVKNNVVRRKTKIDYVDGDVHWHNMEFMPYIVLSVPIEEAVIDKEKLTSAVKNLVTCSICCETFNVPVTTKCMHTFCKECLTRALTTRKNCPLCNDDNIKSMRDTVPENRFNDIMSIMHIPTTEYSDNETSDASLSLLSLAGASTSLPTTSLPTMSFVSPGSPSSSATITPSLPSPLYACHKCGGKKLARAHACGKSCIQ